MTTMSLMISSQINLLFLEETENYINDRYDGRVNIIHSNSNPSLSNQPHPDEQTKLEATLRLCDKSLVIDPAEPEFPIIKVSFQKVKACSLAHIRSDQEKGCWGLILVAQEILKIPRCVISGQIRVVRPYISVRPGINALWTIELTVASLKRGTPIPPVTPEAQLSDVLAQMVAQTGELQLPTGLFFLQFAHILVSLFLAAKRGLKQSRADYSSIVAKIKELIPSTTSSLLSGLVDHREHILISPLRAYLQIPLHRYPGILSVTNEALCFRPFPMLCRQQFWSLPSAAVLQLRRPSSCLRYVIQRTSDLKDLDLSLLYANADGSDWSEVVLSLETTEDRNRIMSALDSTGQKILSFQNRDRMLKHMMELWRSRRIDTYHYLGFLNSVSGRSFADFTQYPVFPWTYVDFDSTDLDLSDPSRFRDLRKPVGATKASNLEALKQRMHDLKEFGGLQHEYMYGSHYSTSSYVVYWLLREYPECQLQLQGGRFDSWHRLFHSIKAAWAGIAQGKASSFLEFIPQFYDPSSIRFLQNRLGISVAHGMRRVIKFIPTDDGRVSSLSDVTLPLWAKGSATSFLKVMREALESEVVSNEIHRWIDLIFGWQQQGQAAKDADNQYHPVTYLTSITNQNIEEAKAKIAEHLEEVNGSLAALLTQVREFGQAPVQIFQSPHPPRFPPDQTDFTQNLSNLQHLLDIPRSSSPWFVHLMQNPSLIPPVESNTEKLPSTKPQRTMGFSAPPLQFADKLSERISFEETDETSDLPRFKANALYDIQGPVLATASYEQRELFCCGDGFLRSASLRQDREFNCNAFAVSAEPLTALAPLHSTILVGDNIGALSLVNKDTVYRSMTSPHASKVSEISCSNDCICSAATDDTLVLWDVKGSDLRPTYSVDVPQPTALSIYEELLLTGHVAGELRLWDTRCMYSGPVWIGVDATRNVVKDVVLCLNRGTMGITFQTGLTCACAIIDIRSLSSNIPLASPLKKAVISRYIWPSAVAARTDGHSLSVATGRLKTSASNADGTIEYNGFVSVVNMLRNPCEVCRWPLQMETNYDKSVPRFIQCPKAWNLKDASIKSGRLYVANEIGSIEILV